MEVKIAEILFKRSVEECKMRYVSVVSDGDAKTFSHLKEVNPYPGVQLAKEECVNHVQKRLGEGLKSVRQDCSKKKIVLGGRKQGALTDVVIKKLQSYYRNSIVKNIPHIQVMKSNILAILEHYSSTDDNPLHHLCPSGQDTWCWYNKALESGQEPASHAKHPPLINSVVIKHIRPVYERLANESLLGRCVRGGTQNANENLHQLIWNKAPKEKFQSKKKLEIAVTFAIAEFNMGNEASLRLKRRVSGIHLSSAAVKVSKQRDKERVRQTESVKKIVATRAKKKALRAKGSRAKKSGDYASGKH